MIITSYIQISCDEQRNFDYIDHIYYFMKREHGITCTRSTFFRYIKDNEELSKKFKNNKTNSFVERFETALVNRLSSI